MIKLLISIFFLTALLFLANYYKNQKVEKELQKAILNYKDISYDNIKCSGSINEECKIINPKYKQNLIADSIDIKNIDLLHLPKGGKFVEESLNIELKNNKYSIWDLLNRFSKFNDFKKFDADYNTTVDLRVLTDGKSLRAIKIDSLRADDKNLPFTLKTDLSGIDSSLKLNELDIDFDLSKKELFLKDIFAQNSPRFPKTGIEGVDKAVDAIFSKDKKSLNLSLSSKTQKSLKEMILPFMIAGPAVLDKFYEIEVSSK